MYVLVCYDVVCNRRRARLHARLKTWLTPVQKSVFEGSLRGQALPELLDAAETLIDPDTDSVRVYQLCRGCRPLIRLVGTSLEVGEPPTTLVF